MLLTERELGDCAGLVAQSFQFADSEGTNLCEVPLRRQVENGDPFRQGKRVFDWDFPVEMIRCVSRMRARWNCDR